MAKFGINVPDGDPDFSVKEVENAAKQLADEMRRARCVLGLESMGCAALTSRWQAVT